EAAQLAGLAATDWTWSVRWEDLDNDGRLDLHVTNGMIREYQNSDLRDHMIVAENSEDRLRVMRDSPPLNETHLAFRNLGDLKFENVSKAWGLNQVGVSFGAAFADFDGDGDLDLIFANYEKGVTLLRNDCQTGHRVIVALRGTQSNRFGVGAVVRIETKSGIQIRQLVLARGYLSSSEPIIHFGTGDDDRLIKLSVEWPSGQTQTFSNLSVDRRYLITEPEEKTSIASAPPPPAGQFENVSASVGFEPISREPPSSDTILQALQPVRLGKRGPALAVADVNGDGINDIVLGGTVNDPLRIFFGTPSGNFLEQPVFGAQRQSRLDDGPVLAFDADGDGSLDLLVTHEGAALSSGSPAYQPSLWLNDGQGNFHAAPSDSLPLVPISAGAVAAADFNRDGKVDVFIGGRSLPGLYPLPARSALLVNRGGKFEDVTDTVAPGLRQAGLVTAAIWTDVDGDGWSDLLMATEWGPVKYFHNDAGQSFSDWTEKAGFASAGTGWWTSLASADFNGDGRPDYVVGNVGLNTQYHATAEEPAVIYFGSFGGAGGAQLIEGYYENGQLFPWRTRHDLGAKLPGVLKKFPRNDDYAKATLEEIFGPERLARAKRFAATNLNSGVFLSQPDGTYRFEPLPRIAQIAPLQGIVAGDFDGDGLADIYTAQNSFAPTPVVGHFDGGISQFLRGDGHGHFTAVPARESGLIVPGDAKAVTVLDLDHDGWPDFLVTRNNNTALAFRNRSTAGHHSFEVRLHGAAGNPEGIGARITVEMADGTIQAAEVFAGSGYYSQYSSCFFGYKDQPPRQIKVRWPNGKTTEHAFLAGTRILVLEAR
ncbi:MAG TPA: FG-GAP-like repeat-containing protein, partial [Opitutaceae bacterium]